MEKSVNPWIVKSSTEKYDNPWMKVTEHSVINAAGNDGIYGVVHIKHYAIAVIPLDKDYNTWIVGQHRFPFDSYEWEIIEGGCPEGTSPLESAKRELKEEAGIEAKDFKLILEMQLSNSKTDEISYSYIAKELSFSESEPDEDEVLSIRKIPFQELVDLCLDGTIKDALSIATVLKAKLLIDKGFI